MKLIELLNNCYDRKGRLKAGNAQKQIINLCDDLDELPGNSFGEKVYLLQNKMSIPKCPTCGKELTYNKIYKYSIYCSNKCRSNNNVWKNNRIGKGFQSSEVQQKIKESLKEKTGYSNVGQIPEVRLKIKEKLLLKGRQWRNSEEAIDKIKQEIKEKEYILVNTFLQNDETYFKIRCNKHNHEWNWTRLSYEFNEGLQHILCEKCKYEKQSQEEKEVLNYIKSVYNGQIIENDRCIIKPKEIDIYLPELKLGIEYCGNIWHSSKFLDKNYHLKKLELANQNGIKLLQVWSSEWYDKQDIVKSILFPIISNRIFARKCIIKEIDNDQYKRFCEENHIQGYSIAKIRLGLFHEDKLIQIMSFSKPRMNKKYEYEMIRECSKLRYQIIGGKSKLLSYFEKNYKPKSIVSYCDKRLFDGHSYIHLGFTQLKDSLPNYQYIDTHKVYSRFQFQKHKLKSKLKIYYEKLSEKENCEINGLYQLYDCGNKVFIKEYK